MLGPRSLALCGHGATAILWRRYMGHGTRELSKRPIRANNLLTLSRHPVGASLGPVGMTRLGCRAVLTCRVPSAWGSCCDDRRPSPRAPPKESWSLGEHVPSTVPNPWHSSGQRKVSAYLTALFLATEYLGFLGALATTLLGSRHPSTLIGRISQGR